MNPWATCMIGSGVGRSDMAMLLRIRGARSEDLIVLPVAGCPHRLSVPTHDEKKDSRGTVLRRRRLAELKTSREA